MNSKSGKQRLTRRRFLQGTAGALGATGAVFGGYSLWRMQGESAYETSLDTSRRAINESNLLAEIVRFATLGPNSHNTQPWRFEGGLDSLSIGPDFTRRCPVVDPL